VTETLLQQKLHLHQNLFGEITRLSENKEIASKLNLVLSSPLDKARPPLLPIDPRLLLFTFLGSFSGFFFSLSFLLFNISRKGLPATPSSLKQLGQQVLLFTEIRKASSLETLPDDQLDGLRKLLQHANGHCLFLGFPDHLFPLLASLYFRKTGNKACLLNLDGSLHPTSEVLEHAEYTELVVKKDRFLPDTLASPAFQETLKKLEAPLLLAYSSKKEEFPRFNTIFFLIEYETLDNLEPFFFQKPFFCLKH